MSREFSYGLYHSREWQHVREQALRRDHYLCKRCLSLGRVTPAVIVHHVVHLTPGNVNDPRIALDLSNLTCLCRDCHAIVHGFDHEATRADVAFDADGNLVMSQNA